MNSTHLCVSLSVLFIVLQIITPVSSAPKAKQKCLYKVKSNGHWQKVWDNLSGKDKAAVMAKDPKANYILDLCTPKAGKIVDEDTTEQETTQTETIETTVITTNEVIPA